jgi:hypothetical protein
MFYLIEVCATNGDTTKNFLMIRPWAELNADSGDICLMGACGIANGWATYAHGRYHTALDAYRAMLTLFGVVRPHHADASDEVHLYQVGHYTPLTPLDTITRVKAVIADEVTETTTNEDLGILAEKLEADANAKGYTLDTNSLLDLLLNQRNGV